jgi:hypothetical protein
LFRSVGDFDNDGRLISRSGIFTNSGGPISRVANTGSGFNNVPIPGLQGVQYGSVACGDCQRDGRLDS